MLVDKTEIMKGRSIIKICNGVPRMPKWQMKTPVNFELLDGEQIAIYGENASGKSMLVDIIRGSHPLKMQEPSYDFYPSEKPLVSDNICYIAFRDCYGGDNDRTYFLQQRWNQQEIDESTPKVANILDEAYQLSGSDDSKHQKLRDTLYTLFDLQQLLDKYIILLSSGELRKVQLTKILLKDPRVLIMDNPFIGLDIQTREQLRELLKQLIEQRPLQLILVINRQEDIPDFITHIVEVKNKVVCNKLTLQEFKKTHSNSTYYKLSDEKRELLFTLSNKNKEPQDQTIVKLNQVSICYGNRIILDKLSWTIKTNEKWALSGRNGSGKSTLLSLICADNPQSYACDITLFGHHRGSGESIWDIKKNIGYVSPEMHRAYQRDIPCIKIVASGLKDSIGMYVRTTKEEEEQCHAWMSVFGLSDLEERSFMQISSGEQRLILLIRAFVKAPDLLILDEPLHGLDDKQCFYIKEIIDTYCSIPGKTLIMVSHYENELPSCINNRKYLTKSISK